ncbi:MAG: 2-oxo acid dehydrogenase subunit E2 [Rhodopirellula sp.]|nr:2-oxo acid dehydrogenase subunit E2 [Rhodopirellula sp.]
MAIEITVPRLGWSMDEGTFGEWLKVDGEFVEPGEPIFTLESEKSVQEVESVDGGFLRLCPDGPQEGDTVTVGTLIGFLLEENEDMPVASGVATAPPAAPAAVSPAMCAEVEQEERSTSPNHKEPGNRTLAISPRAARLARQLGIDWSGIKGSGKTGRIRERDIVAVSQSKSATSSSGRNGSVRSVIAKRMLHSAQNTAAVTLTLRADATNLVSLRQQFKASGSHPVPAYHDILMKLTGLALRRHPNLNCLSSDDGIIQPDGIHIGLAVDTETGLLVPVITNADGSSLSDLATRTARLIERARQRKCSAAELTGGTFTITNLGAFGIDAFTPIINAPQTAILGIGAIRREATVLDDDRIVARDQLTLSLTFDHQVVDGAPAAAFLQTLCQAIENPSAWLIA